MTHRDISSVCFSDLPAKSTSDRFVLIYPLICVFSMCITRPHNLSIIDPLFIKIHCMYFEIKGGGM